MIILHNTVRVVRMQTYTLENLISANQVNGKVLSINIQAKHEVFLIK